MNAALAEAQFSLRVYDRRMALELAKNISVAFTGVTGLFDLFDKQEELARELAQNPGETSRSKTVAKEIVPGLGYKGKVGVRAKTSRCRPEQHRRYQNSIDRLCKSPPPASCEPTDICNELRRKMFAIDVCRNARRKINNICFEGGDFGHRKQVKNQSNRIIKCLAYIRLKQC